MRALGGEGGACSHVLKESKDSSQFDTWLELSKTGEIDHK